MRTIRSPHRSLTACIAFIAVLAACSPNQVPPPSVSDAPMPSGLAGGAGRIAFQANRANETSGIYLMEPDGSNVEPLVDDAGIYETDPVWSPDGSLIAYAAMSADGQGAGAVFMVDLDGGEPVQVTDALPFGVVWSPDGAMLAVGGDGGERGLGIYDVAQARFDLVTQDGGTAPHWSPDGTRIAYDVPAQGGDVWVLDVASGEARNLTDSDWSDSVARWTEDGTGIVFVSDRDTDRSADAHRSWMIDADGGEPELLGEPVIGFAHWPSPDGQWLAYAAPDGSGLRLSRADGTEDRAVHPTVPADHGPSWAADSSAFMFSTAFDAPRDLFLMRVGAETPEQITDDPADDSAPSWGPPRS